MEQQIGYESVEPRPEAVMAALAAEALGKPVYVIARPGGRPEAMLASKVAAWLRLTDPRRWPQILGVGYPPGYRRNGRK